MAAHREMNKAIKGDSDIEWSTPFKMRNRSCPGRCELVIEKRPSFSSKKLVHLVDEDFGILRGDRFVAPSGVLYVEWFV